MQETAIDGYVAAFVARHGSGDGSVRGLDGVYGTPATLRHPQARLLVTDDRVYDHLDRLLPAPDAGIGGRIDVVGTAPRCAGRVVRTGWLSSAAVAMGRTDLAAVPRPELPTDLELRRVRLHADDDPSGIGLEDAVGLAVLAADDASTGFGAALIAYLRSLPPAFRLFAAVDAAGAVVATSGRGVFGTRSVVLFVNTAPDRRRCGLGGIMTAAALRDAHAAGAHQAFLDASAAGVSVYCRLGFEELVRLTCFEPPLGPGSTTSG